MTKYLLFASPILTNRLVCYGYKRFGLHRCSSVYHDTVVLGVTIHAHAGMTVCMKGKKFRETEVEIL